MLKLCVTKTKNKSLKTSECGKPRPKIWLPSNFKGVGHYAELAKDNFYSFITNNLWVIQILKQKKQDIYI